MKSTAARKNALFLIPAATFLLLLSVMAFLDARSTGGHLYYPLDDTYIHMAISKNLALHGVWGATRYHFAASSSSILYTLVLSGCFSLFGVHEIIPLILGAISTLAALYAIHRRLARFEVSNGILLTCEMLLVLVVPLPAMALLGMEHGFQLLCVALLGFAGVDLVSSADAPTIRQVALLALLAALAEGFRFESAFLALVIIVALAFRRRYAAALAAGFGTVLPVAAFGIVSHQQGWPWLPVSVLIKGNMPHGGSIRALLATMGGTAIRTLAWEPLLLILVILSMALLVTALAKGLRWWSAVPLLLITFVATCLLHLQFASVGWLMRYEMYLVGYAIAVNAVALDWLLKQYPGAAAPLLRRLWLPAAVLALFVSIPFVQRSFGGFKKYVQSGRDRWQIHIRPALFVKRYYDDSTVVVNDLGAMSFYTDARVIDVFGLGDIEPLNLRHSEEGYTKESVAHWIAGTGARLAVIQTGWAEVKDRIPDSWQQVGKFQAERNVVWGDVDIGFFSISPRDADELKRNLAEFDREVPMK